MALEEDREVEEPLVGDGKLDFEEARWFHTSRNHRTATPHRRLTLFFLGTVLPWFLLILLGLYTGFQHWGQGTHKVDPSQRIYSEFFLDLLVSFTYKKNRRSGRRSD
jgi:hypothetical protein